MSEKIRLQKYLSACGVVSRRRSEEYINAGRVAVNGSVSVLGDKVDPDTDVVTLDGEPVEDNAPRVYIALYKPRGYLSSVSDDRGRRCVTELVSDIGLRLYPVGRLDYDSEGLLIMTNDGEFANRLMHPSYRVDKTYVVTVSPAPTSEQLNALRNGVVIDGRRTARAKVAVRSEGDDRAVLRVTIHEGRNRQIRRMCEEVGLDVLRLKRVSEGAVRLGSMKPGQYRSLTPDELDELNSEIRRQNKC